MICAALGILLMIAVVRTERLATSCGLAPWLRPAVGGALVGAIALVTPQVLSAGHGAMHLNLETGVALSALLEVFALKALASALTIGALE